MDPFSIAIALAGTFCCGAFVLLVAGGAYYFLTRNKGDSDSAAGALDAMSSLASSARSASEGVAAAAQQAAQQATSAATEESRKRAALAGLVGEDRAADMQGLDNVKVLDDDPGMTLIRQSGEAALLEDPDDGIRVWVWRPADGGADKPAEEWVDHWGPVPPGNVEVFCDHWCDHQDAEGAGADSLDEVMAGLGYPDVGSWHRVYWTAVKHFGRSPGPGAPLSSYDTSELMMQQMMPARMRQQTRKAQANAASDNSLLAPVEGITVEAYADCAAAAAQGMSPDDFSALLAQHGMDAVKWERVNAEWSDRMSKDATMTIVQIYGAAFQSAGRGQFGGAGQATAAVQATGGAAGGGEPVPFERLCEIQGAMSVWSTTGQDVNGMLKEVFGLTAMDWSNIQSWWMSKMQTDWELMQRYDEKAKEYEAQYQEAAGISGGDPDADIQF